MTRDKGKFTPGSSGNPSGKSKTAWLSQALRLELAQEPARARRIAKKILDLAEAGDLAAANIVFDRTEGKPTQQIDVTTTTYNASPEEVDQRITELANRLKMSAVLPLLELTASEVEDDDAPRH